MGANGNGGSWTKTNKTPSGQPDLLHHGPHGRFCVPVRICVPKFKAKGFNLFAKMSSGFLIWRMRMMAEA